MDDPTATVSYGHTGHETLEDQLAERKEERERFRRRLLRCIRGWLRENCAMRWWTVYLLVQCLAVAWVVACALHATGRFHWIWLPGWGVIASWPLFVAMLYLRARREGSHFQFIQHWDAFISRDDRGQIEDVQTDDAVEGFIGKVWRSDRYNSYRSNDNPIAEMLGLAVISVGTWLIWDLLRMAPALTAEIILDGVIVPGNPRIADQLPSEPWYKNAFLNTGLHFVTMAAIVTIITAVWLYYAHYH